MTTERELEALAIIVNALAPLSREEIEHVIIHVAESFGITVPPKAAND